MVQQCYLSKFIESDVLSNLLKILPNIIFVIFLNIRATMINYAFFNANVLNANTPFGAKFNSSSLHEGTIPI